MGISALMQVSAGADIPTINSWYRVRNKARQEAAGAQALQEKRCPVCLAKLRRRGCGRMVEVTRARPRRYLLVASRGEGQSIDTVSTSPWLQKLGPFCVLSRPMGKDFIEALVAREDPASRCHCPGVPVSAPDHQGLTALWKSPLPAPATKSYAKSCS